MVAKEFVGGPREIRARYAASGLGVTCCRYDLESGSRLRPPVQDHQFAWDSRTGSARIIIASMTLKIAVFAPIPNASESTAMVVNSGFLLRVRQP